MIRHAMDIMALAERHDELTVVGPLAAPGRLRRLAPFALVTVVASAMLLTERPAVHRAGEVVVACGLALLMASAAVPWRRAPRGLQSVVALAPILLIAAAVNADGGLASKYIYLQLPPSLWLALYESSTALWIAIAMTTTSVVYELGQAPTIASATRAVLLVALAVTVLPTVRRLVSIDRAALTALAELARRDPLTGLINRRGFESRFSELDLTSVDDLVLTYIDIDHFKQINDTLGHSAGDELLVQVGRRLLQATRADDLVARVGGDEFLGRVELSVRHALVETAGGARCALGHHEPVLPARRPQALGTRVGVG